MRTMSCELLAMSYELWAVSYELWAVSCELLAMSCELWAVSYELWAVSYELWAVSYELWTVSYELWAVSYELWAVSCELDFHLTAHWIVPPDLADNCRLSPPMHVKCQNCDVYCCWGFIIGCGVMMARLHALHVIALCLCIAVACPVRANWLFDLKAGVHQHYLHVLLPPMYRCSVPIYSLFNVVFSVSAHRAA
jgi:hypothetical protein